MIVPDSKTIRLLQVDPRPDYLIKDLNALDQRAERELVFHLPRLKGGVVRRVLVPVLDRKTKQVRHIAPVAEVWYHAMALLARVHMIENQRKKAMAFNRHRRSINARNR